MSIFRKKPKGAPNLSYKIQDEHHWCFRREQSFSAGERVTAVAYDAILKVYVCGFATGQLHLYGNPAVHFTFHVPALKEHEITHIQISPAAKRLLCLVEKQVFIWSLDGILEDSPLQVVDIPDGMAFIGVSAVHSHALFPHPDGTLGLHDLSRLCTSPTKVVPSPDVSEGVIMDIASSPHNIDFLVVATYGSLYLWQFSVRHSLRKFILPDDAIARPVCLAFHPNESVFAAGLIDGRISFWAIDDAVPLWITTISELSGLPQAEGGTEPLEPVFKLSWLRFSGSSRLTVLGGKPAGSRLTTLEFAGTPFSETDQLVSKSSTTYNEYDTANIKDFVILENSGHILALNESGSLTFISLTESQSKPGSDHRIPTNTRKITETLYIPYALRRRAVVGQAVTSSLERFRQFSSQVSQFKSTPLAHGGVARPHFSKAGPDPRLVKYDTPLLIVALHEDGDVHVDDISPRLLIETDVLASPYPDPLPNLTFSLNGLLDEPMLWASLDDTSNLSVQQIRLIPEALELYILFKTGELLVCQYREDSPAVRVAPISDQRIVDLSTLTTASGAFAPRFLFNCKEGPCIALATCEVGFVALAYADSSVYLVDMRGPTVMLHQKLQVSIGDSVIMLRFTICRLEPKSRSQLYLLIFHLSGLVRMLRISKEGSGWVVGAKSTDIPVRKSLPHPIFCLFVDVLTGEELGATAQALAASISDKDGDNESKASYEGCFYRVTVSATAVRCDIGLSGKNGKTVHLDGVLNAGLVINNASSALLLFRQEGNVSVLSLPSLETITSFQEKGLSGYIHTARVLGTSGDFVVEKSMGLEIWSTTSSERVSKPDIYLPVVASPSGQEGGLISWLLGTRPMTGEEFDSLVAGPSRPPAPAVKVPQSSPTSGNELQDAIAATEERGRLVGTLADKTDELEHAAEGMAAQAKRLAAKTQSKKRRFGF